VDKHLTLDQAIYELTVAEKIYKKEIEQLEQECSAIAQEFQEYVLCHFGYTLRWKLIFITVTDIVFFYCVL
jgi:hypothetical protein